jgi:APA family basic amino acid/polyamine antiporter
VNAAEGSGGQLLRIFGLGFGLAVVIGGVVGSGIMRNPGVVAAGFPDARLVLLAWALGGVLVMLDAMPTVELGAAIPLDGGPFSLATRAMGPATGFLVGWADWLQNVISTGFIAVAFGEYVHRLGLAAGIGTGALAVLLVLACGAINWIGARSGGASQHVGTALKGLGLVLLVALLLLAPRGPMPPAPPPPLFTWAAALVAMRAVYGAYGGWQAAIYFSEEVHAPERNVARATFLGIALVTGLYLLVNAAVVSVLPMGLLAGSKLAAADAAAIVLGQASGTVVTVLAILCVATLVNTQVMECMRSTFAMARKGMLPPALATVSTSGTPRSALALSIAAMAAIIILAGLLEGPLYEVLLDLYAPFIMLVFLTLSLAAIRLRRAEPNLPRPWRMPLYPLPALLSILLNGMLLAAFLVSDWKAAIVSALFLLAALPLYRFGRGRWRPAY